VGELHARYRPLLLDKLGDAFECLGVLIGPQAAIPGRNPPFGRNGGGFYHDQGSPANGSTAEMYKVPVSGDAVLAGVLAHGREKDAILKLELLEPEGRKQFAGHHRTSYYRCEKSAAENVII
jgi:hypothetical protein